MKYLLAIGTILPALAFGGMLASADGHKNELEELDQLEQKKRSQIYWTQKPIQCGQPEGLINLVKGYGELPLLITNGLSTNGRGETVKVKLIFAVNQETGSWTLIESNSPSQACVLGTGEGYTINKLPPLKQETKYNVSRKLS